METLTYHALGAQGALNEVTNGYGTHEYGLHH